MGDLGAAGAASPDGGTGGPAGTGAASAAGGTSVAGRVDRDALLRARVAAEGAVTSPVTSTMGGPPEVHTLPPLGR